MESSTVLAFRIFVMLSCLIIVPLAAIFGSAFPDVVKTVLVDRIVSWSTGKPVESPGAAEAPDGFREVTPGAETATAGHNAAWEAPRWGNQPTETASRQVPHGSISGVVPAAGVEPREGFNQSASFSAPSDTHTVYPPVHRVPASQSDRPYAVAEAQQRVLADTPAEANPAEPPPQGAAAGHGDAVYPHGERFAELERKLREAGATYYLLEKWGGDGESYRFHCRMPVGNDPGRTQNFEATASDALSAMSQVVEQVEAWRAGG